MADALLGIETRAGLGDNAEETIRGFTLADALLGIETDLSDPNSCHILGFTLADALLGIETVNALFNPDGDTVSLWLMPF